MSTIALNNRVITHSISPFVSCTALPIRQKTLNPEEMTGIDGLWDWGDAASCLVEGMAIGALTGAAGGLIVAGPPGAVKGFVDGAVVGAVGGLGLYAWKQWVPDN